MSFRSAYAMSHIGLCRTTMATLKSLSTTNRSLAPKDGVDKPVELGLTRRAGMCKFAGWNASFEGLLLERRAKSQNVSLSPHSIH